MTEQNEQNTQREQTQGDRFVWKESDVEIEQATETQEQQSRVHGNTRKAADMDLSKKIISPDSHKAVLEGRVSLDEARALGREGSPVGPAVRVNKADRSRECMCQCGQLTKGGRFIPGHDQRLVTYAKEYVRGERELTDEQLAYVQESGKLDRARKQVEKQEARKAEKAKTRDVKLSERAKPSAPGAAQPRSGP